MDSEPTPPPQTPPSPTSPPLQVPPASPSLTQAPLTQVPLTQVPLTQVPLTQVPLTQAPPIQPAPGEPSSLESSPTRSDGRVLGALSLLLGTLLVLVLLLSGIGWVGWRLYRSEHRSVTSAVPALASNGGVPSSASQSSASDSQGDHPPSVATTSASEPPDLAVTTTAPTTQPTGATNSVNDLTGFSPAQAATGEIVTLAGHGLSKTDEVVLIPMDGSSVYEAATIEHTDTEVTFAVPEMGGTMSLNFALGVFTDDGASLLIDQSVPATALVGVTPTSKGAVQVSPGDSFTGQDHLLVVAGEGSRVAVGDNCFVVLEKEAKLCVFGKNCHVFANFDRQVLSPGEIRGNTNLPSVHVTLVQHDFEYRPGQ